MEKNLSEVNSLSKQEFAKLNAWGLLSSINLYGCDSKLISSPKAIEEFVVEICKVIKMTRHGNVLVDRFGDGDLEGYSAMQFIETSSITIHFDEGENRAFIDIFSCKYFEADKALKFSKEFFKAKKYKIINIVRK